MTDQADLVSGHSLPPVFSSSVHRSPVAAVGLKVFPAFSLLYTHQSGIPFDYVPLLVSSKTRSFSPPGVEVGKLVPCGASKDVVWVVARGVCCSYSSLLL